MSYKASGRVTFVGQTQQITEKFTKRDFFIEVTDNGRVNPLFLFLSNTNVALGDQFPAGSMVDVDFDINCRQFTTKDGRTFNNVELRAWRVQPYNPQQAFGMPQYGQMPQAPMPAYQQYQQPPIQPTPPQGAQPATPPTSKDDSLPF